MKLRTTLSFFVFLAVSAAGAFAQSVGDYRSNGNGDWDAAATWQRWNGTTWATASAPPTGAETITIQAGDTVDVNVAVTISDTVISRGHLTTGTNLTIAGGGVFQHDQDHGSLPMATWEAGSTLYITGTTGVAPDDRNQNFHHIVFNTPGLLANLNMNLDSVTIGGDIRVISSGSARWYITSTTSGDTNSVWIMGDIIVENGAFSSNGTGNANTHFEIFHFGNVRVTGGNFSVSRGSQGSGSGSTRWYLYGDTVSLANAVTQNSNAANAWFIFARQGTQHLSIAGNVTQTAFPIVVDSGTILDVGLSKIRGSGRFELRAGAALGIGEAGGLDSAVAVTGPVSFDRAAQYIFNGTGNQETGVSIPDTLYSIINENPDTLKLSDTTTIYGPLILRAGIFDNTVPFDLGGTGWILFEGGHLRYGVPVSVEQETPAIPESFTVEQNYPNPFNPRTTITYGLPEPAVVSVAVFNMLGQKVATLFEGMQGAGIHKVEFDATRFASGIYLYRVRAGGVEMIKRMILIK